MKLDDFTSYIIGLGFLIGLFGIPIAYGIDLIFLGQLGGFTHWTMTTAGCFMIGGIILHIGSSALKE